MTKKYVSYSHTNDQREIFIFKYIQKDIKNLKFYLKNLDAAAKSLESCPTLCDPIDGSPLGSSVPGILQARTLEWVAISFSKAWKWKVKIKSLSRAWLLATPWTAAHQAPLPWDVPGKSTGVGCHCLLHKNLDKEEQIKNSINRKSIVTVTA